MGLHCFMLALFGFSKHHSFVLALFGFSKHQGLCRRWVSFETWFHIESIPPWFSKKLCFSHIGNWVARRAPIAPSLISKNIDAKPVKKLHLIASIQLCTTLRCQLARDSYNKRAPGSRCGLSHNAAPHTWSHLHAKRLARSHFRNQLRLKMHIQQVVIDGFKSYAKRTVVEG